MKNTVVNPTDIWLYGFLSCNFAGFIWMFLSGKFIGDAVGDVIGNEVNLIVVAVFVLGSYVVVLKPVLSAFQKLPIKPLFKQRGDNRFNIEFGKTLVGLQILFAAFNMYYGVNIAGASDVKADTYLSLVWVLLPVDALFIIYYAVARDTKYWLINLILFVVSNVARGWTGIFLFIIFFESCRLIRGGRFNYKFIGAWLGLVALMYPVIVSLKWGVRIAGKSNSSLIETISIVVDEFSFDFYFDIFLDSFLHLISRLQIVSAALEMKIYSATLAMQFNQGNIFLPFWLEGLHGIAYDRYFLGEVRPTIGFSLAQVIMGSNFVATFNVNPTLVGWFFVAPLLVPVLIGYTLLLCFLSVYFAKKIDGSNGLSELIWLSWCVYLIPGWFVAFFAFIYSLMVFILLKIIFGLRVLRI